MIKRLLTKEQFNPSIFGIFVNPFYFARKGLYENISALACKISGDVLDVGCGQKPYQHLISVKKYTGLEIDTPQNRANKKADFFYDGHEFPFRNNEYDCVIANQVLEHVFNPGEFLSEIGRVLKPGGRLLLTVPFVWDEHEQPYDYARYSSFGLKHLLETHGFAIVEQRKSIQDIRVIFQLLNAYIYKVFLPRNKYIRLLFTIMIMAPISLFGEIISKVLPDNEDLYLDNCILAKKRENCQCFL